jgi:predicted MFS family arabinose efflux permease
VAATSSISPVFLAAGVVSGAAAALTLWTADEGRAPAVRTPPFFAGLRAVPVTVRLSVYLVMVAEFCYVGWVTFFPLALKGAGRTPEAIGLVFALYGVAISVVRTAMAWLVHRLGRLGVLVAAFAFLAAGLWLSLFTASLPATLSAAVLLGLGGLVFPMTIVLVSAPTAPDQLGRLLAVRFLAITVGQMLGPALTGLLAGYNVLAALVGVAVLASATTVWVAWVRGLLGDTFLDTPKSAMLR